MTDKPSVPAEFRMPASDFDKMMRGALSAPLPAPPAPPKTAPKKATRTKALKKRPAK